MTSYKKIVLLLLILPSFAFAGSADWVSITSDKLKGSKEESYVVFDGNVVATGQMVLCSDELRVSYDGKKIVKDVVAKGNVRVFKDNKKAEGNHASYSKTDGTITITGSAKLTECQGEVEGDSIVFNIDGSGAKIEGAKDGRASVTLSAGSPCNETPYIKRVEDAKDLCK